MTWMIYGANGYTGEITAREAVARGHKPVLAGRSEAAVASLAQGLGLEFRGFSLDDDAVAPDDIAAIGPGGNFLMEDQTVKLCREIDYNNPIWPDLSLEEYFKAFVQEHQNDMTETQLAERLGITLVEDHATENERQRARQIARDKFGSSGWTCRR